MEDTHLTVLDRLSTLVAIIAIAFVWAYLVDIDKHKNINPFKLKEQCRRAYSFFKYGLIRIAHTILNTMDTSGFKNVQMFISTQKSASISIQKYTILAKYPEWA